MNTLFIPQIFICKINFKNQIIMEVEMNNQSEVKKHIDNVIERTFKALLFIYDKCANGNEGKIPEELKSRIIFPKYSNGQLRISEQELRFVFVEQLNREINDKWLVYYSVETPTISKYRLSGKDAPKPDNSGRSANFDLVIHDENYNRIALIEFKANNADRHDHNKDFKKLSNKEENPNKIALKYFIELVESSNDATFRSLWSKTSNFEDEGIIFRCLCLKNGEITEKIKRS